MNIISKFSNSITKTMHRTCRLVSLLWNEPVDTFQEHDERPGNSTQKSNQKHAIHARIQQAIHTKHSYAT